MPECWKESALLGPLKAKALCSILRGFKKKIIVKSVLLRDSWIDEPILYRFFPNGII